MRRTPFFVAALLGAASLAACQSTPQTAPEVPSQRNISAAISYGCEDGTVFTAVNYVGSTDIELRFADGSRSILPHVMSASGAKYQNAQHLFWSKGEEAQYALGSRVETTCRIAK